MIPKIIHFCWFGGNPLPKSAVKCIDSWRKYLPEYEIKEWNEENFDVNIIPYTAEAYKARKFAYVSDYARFWILNRYGGLYFDTDVEVIRPLDDIIARGNFMGFEKNPTKEHNGTIAPGLGIGMCPHNEIVQEILELYEGLHYEAKKVDGIYKTVVHYTTDIFLSHGLQPTPGIRQVKDFYIYPKDYFNPLEHINQLMITENTRTIHHYAGTWIDPKEKLKKRIVHLLGPKIYKWLLKFKPSSEK